MRRRAWREAATIEQHAGLAVVRDDLLEGGSKLRFLPALIPEGTRELVFGGPFCGGAPLALSVLGREWGLPVTLFYAKRAQLHPRQAAAQRNGARLVLVPHGYLAHVQAAARAYASDRGALFLPLGFDQPEAEAPYVEAMQAVRRRLGAPDEVWCASGSGMLARCLGLAFPSSAICAVAVGLASRHDRQRFTDNVQLLDAGLPFARPLRAAAPFPCCAYYDRKAWARAAAAQQAAPGKRRLFWNVLG